MRPDRPERLYRWRFVGLCLSVFLLYVSYQLLLAVLPLHALALGLSEAQLGLIPGIFALSAMLWRPLAGRLADSIGRRPLVLLGPAIFALSSLGYGLVTTTAGLLALRFFHGVGMGFGPTAASVVVADVAPVERRGEAMAVFGLTTTTGLAAAPYVGIEISGRWGANWTFLASAAIASVALLLALSLPETRPAEARPSEQLSLASLFSRGALYPSTLLLFLLFTYGGIITFLPLFAQRRGLGNPGVFFAVFALAVLVTRTQSGRLADRFGRRLVLVPALIITGVSLAVLAGADSRSGLMAAAALYGVGFGAGQPALMAMTADRVPPAERGRALGTFFTAFELGILGGAMLLGPVATGLGYTAMWWVAAGVAWLGALAAFPHITRQRG